MGADFCLVAAIMDVDKKPNWKAALRYIREDFSDIDNHDPEELVEHLRNFIALWNGGSRDTGVLYTGHLKMLCTGGMTWGDDPTDSHSTIWSLMDAGVLDAAGFSDGPNYKEILLKVLENKEILPLLVGTDPELDKMVEERLKQ